MRLRGLASARTLWWAYRAAKRARHDLRVGGLEQLSVAYPPALPAGCRRWVRATLRTRHETCLVRSAVLQAWDAAHEHPRDLLIGVTAPGPSFRAHAWLEGEPASASDGFVEVTRRPPSPAAQVPPASASDVMQLWRRWSPNDRVAGGDRTSRVSAEPATSARSGVRAAPGQPDPPGAG